ncbi:MAG: imelysin family protein [Flavobacterium sp.]
MKNTFLKAGLILAAGVFVASCSSDSDSGVSKQAVVKNYADIVYQNYKDAYDDAVQLETAINTFTTTPTDANFTAVKNKWKQARESYGTTEAFRFANGPIDDEADGPEGLLNSWPLDENFIDYVDDNGTIVNGGIINNPGLYPTIDKPTLEALNANTSEENISVGYHAIEFLLWGQDLTAPSANLPGQRPYTDYVVGAGGTATNQARRATYLKVCADLLTDNLDYLVDQWKAGGTYRTVFLNLPVDTAIRNIYLGITTLVLTELPIERMDVALSNESQEDEHSCFSDNTHRDIYLNLKGIINVYKGEYQYGSSNISGASLEDLVQKADATAYNDTETSLNACLTKMAAIPVPFDLAISGGAGSADGQKVKATVLQLQNFGSNLLAGATKIGITVN